MFLICSKNAVINELKFNIFNSFITFLLTLNSFITFFINLFLLLEIENNIFLIVKSYYLLNNFAAYV